MLSSECTISSNWLYLNLTSSNSSSSYLYLAIKLFFNNEVYWWLVFFKVLFWITVFDTTWLTDDSSYFSVMIVMWRSLFYLMCLLNSCLTASSTNGLNDDVILSPQHDWFYPFNSSYLAFSFSYILLLLCPSISCRSLESKFVVSIGKVVGNR